MIATGIAIVNGNTFVSRRRRQRRIRTAIDPSSQILKVNLIYVK